MYNHSIYLFILFTYKIILYSLKLYILIFWVTKGLKFQIAKKKFFDFKIEVYKFKFLYNSKYKKDKS